jgi:glycosyltransferase involved in cell wall biosynthesis
MGNQKINKNPLVSIVIVNYNTSEVTSQSLQSILDNTIYSPYEIITIDNASEKEDQNILKNFAESKNIPIDIMNENIGWNRAVIYGFSKAKGDLLLTINSDVLVEKGWLTNMVETYFSEDLVGAVNANIIEDGKSVILARDNRLKLLHAACSMFSSEAWNLVGDLDYKNFVFYGTENDWSYRARSMGYKLLLSEKARVNHLGTSTEFWTTGGGLSVQKTGKIKEHIQIRIDGRIKIRAYNFKLKDWIQKDILFEFKDALKNGYFLILVATYFRVFSNLINIYSARRQRYFKMKNGIKIIESRNIHQ